MRHLRLPLDDMPLIEGARILGLTTFSKPEYRVFDRVCGGASWSNLSPKEWAAYGRIYDKLKESRDGANSPH